MLPKSKVKVLTLSNKVESKGKDNVKFIHDFSLIISCIGDSWVPDTRRLNADMQSFLQGVPKNMGIERQLESCLASLSSSVLHFLCLKN